MYIRDKLVKVLKIKNVIFVVYGMFNVVASIAILISLVSFYSDQLETVLYAKATPQSIVSILLGTILLVEAYISRCWIGDANFYSGYFEGDLDGYITYNDLADVTGKSANKVKRQLHFFRKIYMKNYELEKVEHIEQVVLHSKICKCECKNCGAPIDKRIYFTGICSYCGSSDLFARVLTDNRFYSIENNMSDGIKKPEFYAAKNLKAKLVLFLTCLCMGLSVFVISIIAVIDHISKYNNEEYLIEVLLSGTGLSSFELIQADIMENIIWWVILALAFIPVVCNRLKKIRYVYAADTCSQYFSGCKRPFVNAENLPNVRKESRKEKIMKLVRGALRRRYLLNCTIEKHDDVLKVALAKKIVKDKCPSCGGPIVGAVDENYRCQYCRNIIMEVIRKK